MRDSIFQRDVHWQHESTGSGTIRSPGHSCSTLAFIAIASTAGAALIIRLLVGLVSGAVTPPPPSLPFATMPPAATATAQPTATVLAPTPTPSCTSGTMYLKPILLHEARSQWEQAASTAEVALHDLTLCSSDVQALAGKSVTDGLEALFAQRLPLYSDMATHQHQVDRYHSLKRQAAASTVPFPSSIQIATRAYQGGLFLLSQAAFEDAWIAGDFTVSDQSLIQQYTSALFNQGYHLVHEGDGTTSERGLQLLATCYQVDTHYRVGSGACWGELKKRLGEDESRWPASAATPLLQNQ